MTPTIDYKKIMLMTAIGLALISFAAVFFYSSIQPGIISESYGNRYTADEDTEAMPISGAIENVDSNSTGHFASIKNNLISILNGQIDIALLFEYNNNFYVASDFANFHPYLEKTGDATYKFGYNLTVPPGVNGKASLLVIMNTSFGVSVIDNYTFTIGKYKVGFNDTIGLGFETSYGKKTFGNRDIYYFRMTKNVTGNEFIDIDPKISTSYDATGFTKPFITIIDGLPSVTVVRSDFSGSPQEVIYNVSTNSFLTGNNFSIYGTTILGYNNSNLKNGQFLTFNGARLELYNYVNHNTLTDASAVLNMSASQFPGGGILFKDSVWYTKHDTGGGFQRTYTFNISKDSDSYTLISVYNDTNGKSYKSAAFSVFNNELFFFHSSDLARLGAFEVYASKLTLDGTGWTNITTITNNIGGTTRTGDSDSPWISVCSLGNGINNNNGTLIVFVSIINATNGKYQVYFSNSSDGKTFTALAQAINSSTNLATQTAHTIMFTSCYKDENKNIELFYIASNTTNHQVWKIIYKGGTDFSNATMLYDVNGTEFDEGATLGQTAYMQQSNRNILRINATSALVTWALKNATEYYAWGYLNNVRDEIPPSISIIHPQNRTYTLTTIDVNYTISADHDWCWYSLNNNTIVKLPNCQNFTSYGGASVINNSNAITVTGTAATTGLWLNDTTDWSVFLWVNWTGNFTDASRGQGLVGYSYKSAIYILSNKNIAYALRNTTDATQSGIYCAAMPINRTTFLVLTYNGTSKNMSCYVNGSLRTSTIMHITNVIMSNTTLQIGSANVVGAGNNENLKGVIDETGIVMDTLSSSTVSLFYNNGNGIDEDALKSYVNQSLIRLGYHLNELSGTNVYDFSGYGNNGTISTSSPNWTIGYVSMIKVGWNNLTIGGNDTSGNVNVTSRFFSVDSFPPIINLTGPANATTITDNATLNFSVVSVRDLSLRCSYTLDGTTTNLGNVTNNTFYDRTLTNLSYAQHTLIVNCTDSSSQIAGGMVKFVTMHYNISSESYLASDFETNLSVFSIKINSANAVQSIGADFHYDVNNYTSTSVNNNFSVIILLPLIADNNSNYTFFWNMTLQYSNGTKILINSTWHNQTLFYAFDSWGVSLNGTNLMEGVLVNLTFNLSSILPVSNINRNISVSVNITYNDVKKTAHLLGYTSENTFYNQSFYAPLVSTDTTTYYNASATIAFNGIMRILYTPTYLVNINNTEMDIGCTSNIRAINFTFLNEDYPDQIVINNNSMDIDILLWDLNGTYVANYSFKLNESTGYSICISPEYATLKINATIAYRADGFYERNYYLIDATISHDTSVINLYQLNTTNDGQVRLYLESVLGKADPGKFIKIERYYPSTASSGAYKTVAMVQTTDLSGDALTYLRYSDVYYRFIVQDGTTILKIFSKRQVQISNALDVYAEIKLRLDDLPTDYLDYVQGTLIAFSCDAVNNTGLVSCLVEDTSGLMFNANLTVMKKVSSTWVQVGSEVTDISGTTLLNNVSSFGNGTYWYLLRVKTNEGNIYNLQSETFNVGVAMFMGEIGLFVVLILFIITTLIGSYHYVVGMGMGVISLIFGFLLTGMWEFAISGLVSVVLITGIFMLKK